MRWSIRIPTLLVALLLLAACAAGPGSRGFSGEEAFLEVRNNFAPGQSVTIRLLSGSGARLLLGALSPGQTRTFRVRQSSFVGAYRFVAEVDQGQSVVSIPVVLDPGTRVVWVLRDNLLRTSDRGEDID